MTFIKDNTKKAEILYSKATQEFHLTNGGFSYLMKVNNFGKLLHLYYGGKVTHRGDFSHLVEMQPRAMAACYEEKNRLYSLEHLKQEFPEYGSTDFRHPAITIKQQNGSNLTDFKYKSHRIYSGKTVLNGLPATYVQNDNEAVSLDIELIDDVINISVILTYTVFSEHDALTRSVVVKNNGKESVQIENIMSLNLDLPDCDYNWMQLSGAWSRERHIKTRKLASGIQSIESRKGTSSNTQNPFVALMRNNTTEFSGEVIGATLVYSGNFLAQAEVDTWDVTRLQLGINPFNFTWNLEVDEAFQAPESVLVYSNNGLNAMSQTFHRLFRTRLARGSWRDKERPILINNWEATYFDFDEEKILEIAKKAKEAGIELFVLDDGWFGQRNNDLIGLGDWVVNLKKLPSGISGLSKKIRDMGLQFGLWFEPEMVNKGSELHNQHPEWIIHTPNRNQSHGRDQYVLNFANGEVVNNIYEQMHAILKDSGITYIKWDMNRIITEAYDITRNANQQGELFHRYILGVYDLYDRLINEFPEILFESCASGGARFDAGMLYYAPQGWASDDTDAIERLKIQYGTSMVYPISSIGAHVSSVPNHQLRRITPLSTRANVAMFGAFGYELDLNKLTAEEFEMVQSQIKFFKQYRNLFQFGTFYRLKSPYDSNIVSWMVVSDDQKEAIVGYYKILNDVLCPYRRLYLQGLNPNFEYIVEGEKGTFMGDELMNIGWISSDASSGEDNPTNPKKSSKDFDSHLWILKAR